MKNSYRQIALISIAVAVVFFMLGFAASVINAKNSNQSSSAIEVVLKHLEAERDNDINTWKSTVTEGLRQQPTFNDGGSFWVNSMTINSIGIDDAETQRIKESYSGSDLQSKRGWTNEFIANMVAIKAEYTVDYDNTKVPYNEGKIGAYFYLSKDNQQPEWLIFDNSSRATNEVAQPTYALTINADKGGTIPAGLSKEINGEYEAGAKITLIARSNPGYAFEKWISSNGGSFDDNKKSNAVFFMPENDVTVTAIFKPTE